jgi:hypothetical protein
VRLAIDADAKDKAVVARALEACAEALAAEDFAVELERWPDNYKGIDDALAAGAIVEVLNGEAARQTIAEIVAEGTAGDAPQEPTALERLGEVLANGAEAFFRDRELLRALAQLAETDPAEFACCRAQARTAGIGLRDLAAVLAPLRHAIRASQPPPTAAGEYRISAGRIVHVRPTLQGVVEVALCNFSARIVETITRDDGAELATTFVIEGSLVDGQPLPRITVKASEFQRMEWLTSAWQGRAVVFAGMGTRDHLRCAIELLSPDRVERVEFGHTGWREIDGRHYYLHVAGAIGPDGQTKSIAVVLPELARFILPDPPQGESLTKSIRASLQLLDLGPARLMSPLAGAVYRSVLGPCDFSIHASGRSGRFKTATVALCQQHFGAGFDPQNLPGSWLSTPNALEMLAFITKDAVFTVDDFVPSGNVAAVQRAHGDAGRVFRAQANNACRQRLRSDATLRSDKPPRGLILSTGEDIPRGQSVQARLLALEFSDGDIDTARLTACQQDASAGLYAAAMAGFLHWLAPRYQNVQQNLRAEVADLRDTIPNAAHARTPGIIASLAAGWKYFLTFAAGAGAITKTEEEKILKRALVALSEAATGQAEVLSTSDPVNQFLRLLSGALASGRAHVAKPDGSAPPDASGSWGWRAREFGIGDFSHSEWGPQGRRIGWIDGNDLFLEPEVSYAEAQDLARIQGESLPVTPRILHKRLQDRGLLVSTEKDKLQTRRMIEGRRQYVIHLRADTLSPEKQGESGESGQDPELCPSFSPGSNGQTANQGDKQGRKTLEEQAPASIPPISDTMRDREVFEL